MKKLFPLLIALLILATFANDLVRYLSAQTALRNGTNDLVTWAAANGRGVPRDQIATALVTQAAKDDIRVYQYGQTDVSMQIWTEADVKGTWVVGPYIAVIHGVPLKSAFKTPFVIRDYGGAPYQQ